MLCRGMFSCWALASSKNQLFGASHQGIYAWYDFRIAYHKKALCLVVFLGPLSLGSILCGVISESAVFRKYVAWYDVRVLYI